MRGQIPIFRQLLTKLCLRPSNIYKKSMTISFLPTHALIIQKTSWLLTTRVMIWTRKHNSSLGTFMTSCLKIILMSLSLSSMQCVGSLETGRKWLKGKRQPKKFNKRIKESTNTFKKSKIRWYLNKETILIRLQLQMIEPSLTSPLFTILKNFLKQNKHWEWKSRLKILVNLK